MQWSSTFVLSLALPQAPAWAEVCDKVAADWSTGDPPSGLLGLGAMVALALVGGLASVLRNRLVSALCAGLCVLLAMVAMRDLAADHPVYRAAVIEGCRSRGRDVFDFAVLLAAAAFILARGWTRRRTTS